MNSSEFIPNDFEVFQSPVMLCRLDDKLENEFETDMTDSYSIVVWFGVSHLLHVHDTDVFERVSFGQKSRQYTNECTTMAPTPNVIYYYLL
jgi:hypothetical protein